MCSKKRGSRSCKILSKDEMISFQSITRCRRGRKSCRTHKTRKQCPKDVGKWAEENERLRNVIEESQGKMEDNCYKIHKTSMADVELNEEIRNLQAGDERRGSCALQSNGCSFDPAVVLEPYITMGATRAWRQLSLIQAELSRVLGVQQHQVPATLVHMPERGGRGDENEEEQRR